MLLPRLWNLWKKPYLLSIFNGLKMKKYLIILPMLFIAAAVSASIEEDIIKLNSILSSDWKKHQLSEVPAASDHVFLRRAMLDTKGTLPKTWEIRKFISDKSTDKRTKLIDDLLNSKENADLMAMRYSDMFRIKSEFPINLWPNAVQFYHRAIHDDLRNDRSLKDMFYEMLTVSGSNFRTAYANFFRASADRSPEGLAKMVLLTVMNMRETEFTEDEFKRFARLFSCVKYKSTYFILKSGYTREKDFSRFLRHCFLL